MMTAIDRLLAGVKLFKEGKISLVDKDKIYLEPAEQYIVNGEHEEYRVHLGSHGNFNCTCPDHVQRGIDCKHIYGVICYILNYKRLRINDLEEVKVGTAFVEDDEEKECKFKYNDTNGDYDEYLEQITVASTNMEQFIDNNKRKQEVIEALLDNIKYISKIRI